MKSNSTDKVCEDLSLYGRVKVKRWNWDEEKARKPTDLQLKLRAAKSSGLSLEQLEQVLNSIEI